MEPIRRSVSAHLKYSFQYYPNSYTDRIYRGSTKVSDYRDTRSRIRKNWKSDSCLRFPGARIKRFNPRLSLNYEWNFGASFGWKPFDEVENRYNKVIGSKINAYINTNFYLDYILSKK